MGFRIKFWGVRGSRTVPGQDTLIFGGNTACIEVRCGHHLLILDAGSGICEFMKSLPSHGEPIFADLLVSHMHWDHILGLPFFKPLYQNGNVFFIHGSNGDTYDFSTALRNVMRDPNFPVSFDDLKSRNIVTTHLPGDKFNIKEGWRTLNGSGYTAPDIKVATLANQHPNGGVFYRISYQGKHLCYVTDTECAADKPEFIEELVRFSAGCHLLVMDANFTRDEYEGLSGGFSKKGWGHATWQDCVAIARKAGAKKLCLFHHKAERSDAEQALIEQRARAEFSATIAAREGLELNL